MGEKNNNYNPNTPSSQFTFTGPAYKTKKKIIKIFGIKPNRLNITKNNIKNLISNESNTKNNIKTEDQKKYEFIKTQSDSFSNNNLFGMQYLNFSPHICKIKMDTSNSSNIIKKAIKFYCKMK